MAKLSGRERSWESDIPRSALNSSMLQDTTAVTHGSLRPSAMNVRAPEHVRLFIFSAFMYSSRQSGASWEKRRSCIQVFVWTTVFEPTESRLQCGEVPSCLIVIFQKFFSLVHPLSKSKKTAGSA